MPRIRVFRLVGTLSSSTQTYSGSLGTSPYRGFWMRSQRASADFSSEGSPPDGSPAIRRTVSHPVNVARRAQASRRRTISPCAPYHSTPLREPCADIEERPARRGAPGAGGFAGHAGGPKCSRACEQRTTLCGRRSTSTGVEVGLAASSAAWPAQSSSPDPVGGHRRERRFAPPDLTQSSMRGSQGKRCSSPPLSVRRGCRREKSAVPVMAEM